MYVSEGEEEEGEGDGLLNCPSRTVIRPAAEARAPWRKDECWNAPGCLIPM